MSTDLIMWVSFEYSQSIDVIFIDFSGSAWVTNNDYAFPLSDSQSAELMEEVRAARYLLTESCDPDSGIYSSTANGWNSCEYHLIVQCAIPWSRLHNEITSLK